MTAPPAAIALDVDLTNAGQFLACCGLLELASRLDPEAVGWFDEGSFSVQVTSPRRLLRLARCSTNSAVDDLRSAKADKETIDQSDDSAGRDKSAPIDLGAPFNLTLDWWTEPAMARAGFKTWAGQQQVSGIVNGMRGHLRSRTHAPTSHRRGALPPTIEPRLVPLDREWLNHTLPIKKPKPFYFDSRISRLTSLDLGFSADGFTTAFSPAVELLALVGMQRFRPSTVVERERYAFATWKEPLPAAVAAAVASGLIPTLVDRRYVFSLVVRTGGKYKAFGPATLERTSP